MTQEAVANVYGLHLRMHTGGMQNYGNVSGTMLRSFSITGVSGVGIGTWKISAGTTRDVTRSTI
ncbi:hypothetical protein BU16DRAFT_528006 [Lophium mytilinum]|uniref:Uncharacterized protein n=1 Tax=Lophium mytilinum TaxID=390894 RepID=A0A6A6QNW3_9PEZI|nr:hypothetical protein BU16DRAFT_528006 [Lophium mytilinum]